MIEFVKPRRVVTATFIHCSASDRPEHDDVSVMRQWHRARGWSDVGYHFFIRKDGEIQEGRDLERIPAAQAGHNSGTIAICLHGLTEERFTEDQFNSLRDLCQAINGHYADMRFRGHKEVAAKACPVFDYKAVLGLTHGGHMAGKDADAGTGHGDSYEYGTIRIFDRGPAVVELQRALNRTGAYLTIDGLFGQATRSAVKAFQSNNSLTVDGIVGPQTWRTLRAYVRAD